MGTHSGAVPFAAITVDGASSVPRYRQPYVFSPMSAATFSPHTITLHPPAQRFHSPCEEMRKALLNLLEAFSQAMISVNSTIASSV